MFDAVDRARRRFLGAAAMTIATAAAGAGQAWAQQGKGPGRLPREGDLPSFRGATTWLNSQALTPDGLRGRVVLVDFCTYTCINWLRSLPYVRAWADRYKEQGLVVIGVHAPEFPFEKDLDNVRRAVRELNITYPMAVDNDHAVWRAFSNQYWPALYIADARGDLRFHHFGEGEYERSEAVIRQLLADAGNRVGGPELVRVDPGGVEAAADWGSLRSPENYLGYERTANFASPGGIARNRSRMYAAPERLRLNQWALTGNWTVRNGVAVLNQVDGRIAYNFQARDLHLVMGPAMRGTLVRFRVRIDGQPPGTARGADIDGQGDGLVGQQQLYQLIRQSRPIVERRFEIEFLDPGAEVFAFTFG